MCEVIYRDQFEVRIRLRLKYTSKIVIELTLLGEVVDLCMSHPLLRGVPTPGVDRSELLGHRFFYVGLRHFFMAFHFASCLRVANV